MEQQYLFIFATLFRDQSSHDLHSQQQKQYLPHYSRTNAASLQPLESYQRKIAAVENVRSSFAFVPSNFDYNWIKYSDDMGVRQTLLLDRREKEDARATLTVQPDSLVPQVQLDGIVTI